MLKQGMTEVLIFLKCQNKIRVGSYTVEDVEIKHG